MKIGISHVALWGPRPALQKEPRLDPSTQPVDERSLEKDPTLVRDMREKQHHSQTRTNMSIAEQQRERVVYVIQT